MTIANPDVDAYFLDGCGRCPLGGTPACVVHAWEKELALLRDIMLQSGLTEERKWGVPVYCLDGKNVVMLGAFKESCVISFLKGSLMSDPEGLLTKQGENVQGGRVIRFTDVGQITAIVPALKAYIQEAIMKEEQGMKVEYKKVTSDDYPVELVEKMASDPAFGAAWEALTPGRKKGYILHFNQTKNSATRIGRIEKCSPKIMQGKGFHD